MNDLFDFEPAPDRYAVLGNPVAHSRSPRIHMAFARQCGQSIAYSAIQVDVGGFAQAVGNFQASGGRGVNVTVPFKREAWELCDRLNARAARVGAVNTLIFEANDVRVGDNTDGAGLIGDLVRNHGAQLAGKSVLLVGAGGAARGVVGPLLEQQLAHLVIANRSIDNARALVADFGGEGDVTVCSFAQLAQWRFDLIVNATAASLSGELPPLPDGILADGGWCYDMMYGAQPTPFLHWGKSHGASQSLDGLGMLVEQAAESFLLWRGVRPQTAPVIALLRQDFDCTPR